MTIQKLENNKFGSKNNSLIAGPFIYIYPIIVSLLVYIGYSYESTLISIFGAGMLFVGILLANIEYNYFYLLFYLPNERLFIIEGLPMGLIAIYVIFLAFKIFIINKTKADKSFIFLSLVILIFSMVKGIVQGSNIIDTEIIRFILNIFIVINVTKLCSRKQYTIGIKSISWFVIGTLSASLLGITNSLLNASIPLISTYFRFTPVNQDPNYYGVSVAVSISFLIVFLKIYKKKTFAIIFSILILLTFGLMTQSRSFLLTCIPNFMLFSILFPKQNIKKQSISTIAMLIVTIILVQLGLFDIIDRVIGRAQHAGFDDIRFLLWSSYLDELMRNLSNFFFGIGRRYDITAFNLAPHNFLIGSWVYYGMILTVLFITSYIFIFRRFRKHMSNKRLKIHYFLPLIVALLGYSFIDGITDNLLFYSIFLWMLSAYLLEQDQRKGSVKNEIAMDN